MSRIVSNDLRHTAVRVCLAGIHAAKPIQKQSRIRLKTAVVEGLRICRRGKGIVLSALASLITFIAAGSSIVRRIVRSLCVVHRILVVDDLHVRAVVIGICEIIPAHSLLLGLFRLHTALVCHGHLTILPVVSLHRQKIHIPLRAISLIDRPGKSSFSVTSSEKRATDTPLL